MSTATGTADLAMGRVRFGIVAMLCVVTVINYADRATPGRAVLSHTAPREIAGLSGGLFSMCGNISSVTTPIIIGYIIAATGPYDGALVFAGLNALAAAVSCLVIVKDIHRLELQRPQPAAR